MKKILKFHCAKALFVIGLVLVPIGYAAPASAAPGTLQFFIFLPNLADPTNGQFQVYNGTSNPVAVYRSGSGSNVAAYSNPCNKKWDGNDWNGGGRLPGTPYGTP